MKFKYTGLSEVMSGLSQHFPVVYQALIKVNTTFVSIFTILQNLEERIALLEIPKKRVRAARAAVQVIPTGALTKVVFGTSVYGNDDMYDAVNNRFNVNTPGFYALGMEVQWEFNATGDRIIFMRVNGAQVLGLVQDSAAQNAEHCQLSHTNFRFAQGDFVEFIVAQDSGGDLDATGAMWMTAQERRYNPDEIPNRIE